MFFLYLASLTTLRRGELALRYVCYGSHPCHAYALGDSGGLARRATRATKPVAEACERWDFVEPLAAHK